MNHDEAFEKVLQSVKYRPIGDRTARELFDAGVAAERERWSLARELLEALDGDAVSFNNAKNLAWEALNEINKGAT